VRRDGRLDGNLGEQGPVGLSIGDKSSSKLTGPLGSSSVGRTYPFPSKVPTELDSPVQAVYWAADSKSDPLVRNIQLPSDSSWQLHGYVHPDGHILQNRHISY